MYMYIHLLVGLGTFKRCLRGTEKVQWAWGKIFVSKTSTPPPCFEIQDSVLVVGPDTAL